jgi:hypothetical protein
MPEETQYFLRVEVVLLVEQLDRARERISMLKLNAVDKNETESLIGLMEMLNLIRNLQSRLLELSGVESAEARAAKSRLSIHARRMAPQHIRRREA